MKQEVITILALVLTKFQSASRHDTGSKYWDSPSPCYELKPCTVLILSRVIP